MISRSTDVKNKNLSITECPETRFQNISEHTCTHCNKVFPTETKMRKHEQIHFTVNQCNRCNKSFKYTKSVIKHMDIHKGEKVANKSVGYIRFDAYFYCICGICKPWTGLQTHLYSFKSA